MSKKPTTRVCLHCRQPVIPGHDSVWQHADIADHPVTVTTTTPAPATHCMCCGTPGAGLCQPCRESHKKYTFIDSLRCPVREEMAIIEGDVAELMGAPAQPLYMGHSEACWTTVPTKYTDAIKAACPKCSVDVPPKKQRPRTKVDQLVESMDVSRGYRAPR